MKNSKYLLSRGFLIICLVNFALYMGQFMMNTLVPRYANTLGAGVQLVGFITSSFSITSMITKPISAPAIDAFKKKKVLILGICIAITAFVGYSLSANVTMIVISRLLHGIATGITVTTCLTMVSDTVPEENLASAIAYFSVIQAFATAVGPSIGISLSDRIGYKYTFLIGAFCQLAALLFLIFYNESEKGKKKKFKVSLENALAKEALTAALIMIFLSSVYLTVSSYLVIFAEGIGISGIGTFFTVYAVSLLICRPIVAQLSGKFGAEKLLPVAIIFYALGMVLISIANSLVVFLLASIFVAFGYGSCQPIIQAICIMSAPPEKRGAASSTSYYGTDIGYLTAPLIFGYIAEHFGYRVMYFSTVISLGIALLIYLLNRSKFRKA